MPPAFATFRMLAVVLVALAQVAPHVALPTAPTKADARPFPCQDRPCGCRTYDACWAGDCCCFTLAEKVAWANARGIVPPVAAEVTPSCCDAPRDACSHCPPKASIVLGITAQRCRGDLDAGIASFGPAVPATPPARLRFAPVPTGHVVSVSCAPFSVTRLPAVPPPRGVLVDC